MRNFLSKLNEFQCFLALLRRNVYQNYFKSLVYHGSFKVGMTHSYGNGRRLDDSKALAELNFEVNHIFIPTVILRYSMQTCLFHICFPVVEWRLLGCRNLVEGKMVNH